MAMSRKGPRADNKRAWRLLIHLPKGGGRMRITFHIGKYTITIIVKDRKQNSRHSAK